MGLYIVFKKCSKKINTNQFQFDFLPTLDAVGKKNGRTGDGRSVMSPGLWADVGRGLLVR